jgi:hypothetical protein
MRQESSGAFEVALECQAMARRAPSGSESEEAAEHAVTLALGEGRTEDDPARLRRDVIRNARHSLRRGRARRLRVVAECGRLAQRGVATGMSRGFVETSTPEDQAIAREMLDCLQREARRCGAHGRSVLAGLLAGETVGGIATSAGVSTATVDRTIRRLRNSAADYRSAA